MKIVVGCIVSFLFFGWLPIFVGTFEAADAVISGVMGIIIALIGFGISEVRKLREDIHSLKKEESEKDSSDTV